MPPPMQRIVDRCHVALGVKPMPILLSPDGRGPATLGIRNPVLLWPEWLISQSSEDDVSSAMCHELAHIRRNDFRWNVLYEIFLLPISFHPAASLIKKRIDQTRELACDEIAAGSLPWPTQYARSLLSIARSMAANQRATTVQHAMGLFDTNTLERRIMNVLAKPNRAGKSAAQASVIATLSLLGMVCIGLSDFSVRVHASGRSDADLQQYAGNWRAKFKGKTFIRIKLEKRGENLTGTISHTDIQTNDEGELTSAEEKDGSDPLEAKLTGSILLLTSREANSQETVQFEMKLTGVDEGELRVLVPPGITAPKPWRLERAKDG